MRLPLKSRSIDAIETRVVLVTRQFGGGAGPRAVDEDLWLRSASVRGALRFWWRALHVHQCTNAGALRDREDALFGSSAGDEKRAGPGRVGVTVVVNESAQAKDLVAWKPDAGDALNGAYFPAQDMGNQVAKLLVPRSGLAASIRLTLRGLSAAHQREISESLVAYIIFGGSGARTRRAAGSLCFASSAEARKIGAPHDEASLREWLNGLPRGKVALPVFSVAHRDGVYLSPPPSRSGQEAQRQLLAMWREFRQDRPHPSSWVGQNGWGETRWPEADSVRIVTGQHARWVDGSSHEPDEKNRGMAPRAHLGLPIVVKFKDDRLSRWNRRTAREEPVVHPKRGELIAPEPSSAELVGITGANKTFDRYGSPVMLSVVRLEDGDCNGAHFRGVVLMTPSHLTQQVVLRNDQTSQLTPGPWATVRAKLVAHLMKSKFTSTG